MYEQYNLESKIESSREIVNKAIKDYKPYKVCAMLSGGDDSVTALEVALYLNIPVDFIIHGVTGTGFPATFEYVKSLAKSKNIPLLIADAKDKYATHVIKKGFYGNASQPKAHHMCYNDLKYKPFRKAISQHIRQRKRNRNVLLLNGARRSESKRRSITAKNPYHKDGPNIWVNIVNDWDKEDELEFLDLLNVNRNPVSIEWGHSGECNCGTTAPRSQLNDIKSFCPATYKLLIDIENKAKANGHNWGWGERNPICLKQQKMENMGQGNLFSMCSGNCETKRKIDQQKKDFLNK